MSRKSFSQEMQEVKDDILMLGSMVENAVMESVKALKDNDLEHSRRVLDNDMGINIKRYEVEMSIMVLMATQQPIARDLRTLAACLNVCTELERMGDYAKGIAIINLRSQGLSMPFLLQEAHAMAEKAVDMLHRALTAFADEDVHSARALILDDDIIDACYQTLYYDAVHNVIGDPRNLERANYVIWVAHNLERVGDRVTNICERIIYMVTGERYQRPAIAKEFVLARRTI